MIAMDPVAALPQRPRASVSSKASTTRRSSAFPKSHHLVITTQKGVYTWGRHGLNQIFKSGSSGIVTAKRATDGSSLLAVADSQVVLLHDMSKGMQRSYRLKSTDVG